MFGKKKDNSIKVMHYEGLDTFLQDYPCTIQIDGENFVIKNRTKPETTVSLPMNRILSFDLMEEINFMLKYHNAAVTTSKDKRVNKYYFVVKYKTSEGDDKHLAFWCTIMEYSKLNKIINIKLNDNPTSYQL